MKKQSKVVNIREAKKAREKQGKRRKARKNQRMVLVVTGLTETELDLASRRKRELPLHRCYLCRREEGEGAVVIDENGEARLAMPPLSWYGVDFGERSEFRFLLCLECRILLGQIKKANIKEV